MNPKTIKQLDKWAGGIICLFLTLFNDLLKLFSIKKDKIISSKKVLFIKLIEQGATVIAYSAIKKSIEFVGKENVYFCVFVENKFILELLDVIPKENILTAEFFNALKLAGLTIRVGPITKLHSKLDDDSYRLLQERYDTDVAKDISIVLVLFQS